MASSRAARAMTASTSAKSGISASSAAFIRRRASSLRARASASKASISRSDMEWGLPRQARRRRLGEVVVHAREVFHSLVFATAQSGVFICGHGRLRDGGRGQQIRGTIRAASWLVSYSTLGVIRKPFCGSVGFLHDHWGATMHATNAS